MQARWRKYFLCLELTASLLTAPGCMMGGGHGGGGGGGGMFLPAATLSSISPSTVTAGGPPFTLTLNGTNFVAGGQVVWNGNSVGNYTFVSSTQVTFVVNAPLVASAGTASIVVDNPTDQKAPSNALSLTIQPFTSSACVLYGLYSFFFTGFETPSSGVTPFTVAGEFGVDASGNVSGEEDFKDLNGIQVAAPITGGTCNNGPLANEGTLTITTAASTSTYTFNTQTVPTPGLKGRMVEAESNGTTGSGRFVFTPPAAFFDGDYVIALIGDDSSGGRMGVVGRFTESNPNNAASSPLTNGLADINDNGALVSSVNTTGNVTAPDLYNRCTATVKVGAQNLTLAFYVITSSSGFAIDIDSAAGTPSLTGFVTSQANAGLYQNNQLNAPVILNTWGVVPGVPISSDTSIGLAFGFDVNAGTFNLQLDSVTAGTPNLNQNLSATAYTIAGTGRGTMTFTPSGGSAITYVVYLDTMNDGYMLQTSENVGFGFFQAQASASLDNGTFLAGTLFPLTTGSPDTIDSITLNSGTISGALAGTYSIPSGSSRGTGTVNQPGFGGNDFVFYIFGPDGFVVMGSDPVQNDAIAFLHM